MKPGEEIQASAVEYSASFTRRGCPCCSQTGRKARWCISVNSKQGVESQAYSCVHCGRKGSASNEEEVKHPLGGKVESDRFV